MRQETIDKLLELASTAFSTQESPDKYARNSAHEAAHAAAFRHSPECADAAVLIASSTFVLSASEASVYSSRIADASHDKFAHERSYRAARESYTDNVIPIRRLTETPFSTMVQTSNAAVRSSDMAVTSSYLAAFSRDTTANSKAKQAALYVYRHTYCATRASYVVSMCNANKIHDPMKRQLAFKTMMSARLNNDLKYDLIEPSILLKIMCSSSIQVVAGLILLGGIIIILCGTWGIAALPFIPTIAIGSTITAMGTGLLAGSFFARKELQRIEDVNEHCEEVNSIA